MVDDQLTHVRRERLNCSMENKVNGSVSDDSDDSDFYGTPLQTL